MITVNAQMDFEESWITPQPARFDVETNTWVLAANIEVPRGHVFDGLTIPFVVSRMQVSTVDIPVDDATMQVILGDAYTAVRVAADLGTLIPGDALKSALVQTLASQLEGA